MTELPIVRPGTRKGSAHALRRSGIREVFDAAWAIPNAIHLEVGEPSFPTPEHVSAAAAVAVRKGMTRYTPNAGIPELRSALADKIRRCNSFHAELEQVVVTTGGVGGLYSALLCIAEAGDEVLVGDPSWPNFRMMCELQGLGVRYYRLGPDNGFQPRAGDIEPLISDRTRVLVINSPNNPTGAVFDLRILRELYELARAHNLWILSDEVYDAITFDKPSVSIASLDHDGRVVTVFSFSKTHAMTGWRVGYLVGSPAIAEMVTRVQEPVTSCVNAPAQAAALAAVTGSQDHVASMTAAYRERRECVLEILATSDVPALVPEGAFYVWIDISGTGVNDVAFSRSLLEESEVAVVPGTTFGPDSGSFIRISLATAPEDLYEGVKRIGDTYNRIAS